MVRFRVRVTEGGLTTPQAAPPASGSTEFFRENIDLLSNNPRGEVLALAPFHRLEG